MAFEKVQETGTGNQEYHADESVRIGTEGNQSPPTERAREDFGRCRVPVGALVGVAYGVARVTPVYSN